MGIQVSECLKDSVELTRLSTRCKSAGWRRYFFIRASVTSWFSATRSANTTGGAGAAEDDFLPLPPEQAVTIAFDIESLILLLLLSSSSSSFREHALNDHVVDVPNVRLQRQDSHGGEEERGVRVHGRA